MAPLMNQKPLFSISENYSQHYQTTLTWSKYYSLVSIGVNRSVNSRKYINILETYLWPVIARHFPTDEYLFQDDNAPYMLLGRQNGGNRKIMLNA